MRGIEADASQRFKTSNAAVHRTPAQGIPELSESFAIQVQPRSARFARASMLFLEMPYRPRRSKKADAERSLAAGGPDRARQLQEQRRQALATRSTLSRLRNRKSDLK
jgi:hypothetical protein